MSAGAGRRAGALFAGLALVAACRGDAGDRSTPATDASATAAGSEGPAAVARPSIEAVAPAGMPADSFVTPQRRVADIVAPRWTNEDARDDAGEFARVASLAEITQGTEVADIGAGDGYYVSRLAPIVGDSGRVYAQDIVPDYLTLLADRVRRAGYTNVTIARGEAHDPRLPAASIDVALMIHMYHEIDQPFGLLWNLATALRPGGRVVILDLDRPTFGHGTPPSLLRCELQAVGYRERSLLRIGSEEYIAVFDAPTAASRPAPGAVRAALARKACTAPTDGEGR